MKRTKGNVINNFKTINSTSYKKWIENTKLKQEEPNNLEPYIYEEKLILLLKTFRQRKLLHW